MTSRLKWTPQRLEAIRRAVGQGRTHAQVAKMFPGTSARRIQTICSIHRIASLRGKEMTGRGHEGVGKIPARARAIILMRDYLGWSWKRISEHFHIRPVTAYNQYKYWRKADESGGRPTGDTQHSSPGSEHLVC